MVNTFQTALAGYLMVTGQISSGQISPKHLIISQLPIILLAAYANGDLSQRFPHSFPTVRSMLMQMLTHLLQL